MDVKVEEKFDEEIERLLYKCEKDNNLNKAEELLHKLAESIDDSSILARINAELVQVEFWRYEYAVQDDRLAIAERGVALAKKALEYDSDNLEANAWAAAIKGLHGLEMGILSSLFYIKKVREHAEHVLEIDETYHSAIAHQILGDLYRLTPPSPIGMKNTTKAMEHLLKARELAPDCPQAKLRLAEMYLTKRQKEKARIEINLLLEQNIEERGPIYAENCRAKGRKLLKKL